MLTSNNKPNIDFINNLFNINLYHHGNLQKIKSDNKIPDNILMQSHLTEFSVTVKYIIDKIITLAKNTEEKNDKNISDNILANQNKISNSIYQINRFRTEIINNTNITDTEIDIVISGLMFDLELYKGALVKINPEETVIINSFRNSFKTVDPAETIPQLSIINFDFLETLLNNPKLSNNFINPQQNTQTDTEQQSLYLSDQKTELNKKITTLREQLKPEISDAEKKLLGSKISELGNPLAQINKQINNLRLKKNKTQNKDKIEYDEKNQLEKMTHLVDKLCEYIAKQDFDKLKTGNSNDLGEKLKTFLKELGKDANDKNDFYCKMSEKIKARWVKSKAILDPIFNEKTIQESRKNIVPLGEHIDNLLITSEINIKRRAEVINLLIEKDLLTADYNLYSCKPFFLPTGFPVYAPKKVVDNNKTESRTISNNTAAAGFHPTASNTTDPIGFNGQAPKEAEYNGFMTKFTPPINSFLDRYRQSPNLDTKLQTEQSDLSQELCLKINI
jgi:hypothetical protein